ncbi:hypothetical protein Ndes2526A_g07774 [Nannochloris sp. 'desiccata']
MDEQSELRQELKRDFRDFLEQDFGIETGQGKYAQQIADILKQYPTTKSVRLAVDLQDLADFNEELHRRALTNPVDCLPAFEDAFEGVVRDQGNASKILEDRQAFNVTFTGEFGPQRVSPRQLTSSLLGQLVEVRGIVTRCTLVRPKLVRSVHYCPTTGASTSRDYRDVTSNRGLPTPTVYPTRDDEGNLLTTQFGLSTYVDHQQITVQELPETAPPGQLPRSVELVVEGDLRDAAKPVSLLSADATSPTFTEEDYDNITELASEPDLMDQLGASLAPSIYGYDWIKKALVLLLAGGRERVLPNGTHLRGDVNCLMVGDPGVAKSQLLRAIMNLAPLCVSTTGRGSSGVGLTAAVVTDQDTGERRLEAGAMVLADRGVVCIDEFDKMNDGDRVAIHEVMEQQTVTIAKAGILTQLNARCSVVAAANPIYGHYDRTISITRNIGLPDSLLSRFDLLFVVLDNNDAARDRDIAEHVLGQHRYRPPGDDGKTVGDDTMIDSILEAQQKATGETQMRVKYDVRLYGPRRPGQKDPLSLPFLKKYIAFAKQRFSAPELTPEATEAISEYYAELRNSAEVKALPVTVRSLETMIRLACAHAKVRLSPFVERSDVDEIISLMDLILKSDPSAQEVRKAAAGRRREDSRTKRTRENGGGGAGDDDDSSSSDDDDEEGDGAAAAEMEEELQQDDEEEAGPSNRRTARRTGAATTPAAAAATADEDEPISDAEEELAGAAASPGAKLRDSIRSIVMELGQSNSGLASITGISGVLREKKIKATRKDILAVLEELEAQEAIVMDGDDFFMSS